MRGEGPVPFEWWIGVLCEGFHCCPTQAIAEWESAPCGLLETILEFRAYAQAKQLYDGAKDAKDLPDHPMIDLVREMDFEHAAGEIERRKTDG